MMPGSRAPVPLFSAFARGNWLVILMVGLWGCSEPQASGSNQPPGSPDAVSGPAPASDPATKSDIPRGEGFDFYVLALSWSPSYCRAEGGEADQRQCAPGRNPGFVVHGLWPQLERGYPEFCATREPDRVPEALGRSILDVIPTMGLVGHQWRKHGSCSGLTQRDFFDTLRAAAARVKVPHDLAAPARDARVDPDAVETAFSTVNPGLSLRAMAVICRQGLLREVRICLSRDLAFRPCGEVDATGCKADTTLLPASR